MDKYNKHRFFTASNCYCIRDTSITLTPSEAMFVRKFGPFSEALKLLKIKRAKFIFCMRYKTTQDYLRKP